jgi:Fe2+ or Zn2+ uptake regulation protein
MACGKRLLEQLREMGVRVTPQRSLILETIAHMDGHISAQDVYLQTRKQLPGLNIATVYRTVEKLHDAGLVDVLAAGSDPTLFSLRDPDHPHGHLVCQACGSVLELAKVTIDEMKRMIRAESDFSIGTDHLTLEGLCGACSQAAGGRAGTREGVG